MDLSIVIRCGDDLRVFDCIDSVDEQCDIVVALSHSEHLEAALGERGIRYCLTPRRNLSMTSNIGIDNCLHDRVIIMDSDTTFQRGCIRELYNALDDRPLARAPISFKHNGSMASRLVAEARDFVNSLPLAFTPGLAFRRELSSRIGGVFFNDCVPYAVDADLNFRLRRAGIPLVFVKKGIVHDTESVSHDLRAAYRIGGGCCRSYLQLRDRMHDGVEHGSLKGVKPRDLPRVLRVKGPLVASYQLVWDLAYWTGFYRTLVRRTAT